MSPEENHIQHLHAIWEKHVLIAPEILEEVTVEEVAKRKYTMYFYGGPCWIYFRIRLREDEVLCGVSITSMKSLIVLVVRVSSVVFLPSNLYLTKT